MKFKPKLLDDSNGVINDDNVMKLFVQFLKHNNAYVNFRANIGFGRNNKKLERFDLFYMTYSKYILRRTMDKGALSLQLTRDIINFAFVWSLTKEGQAYWMRLDGMWRKFIENHIVSLENKFIIEGDDATRVVLTRDLWHEM